jgi:hypothetical protein
MTDKCYLLNSIIRHRTPTYDWCIALAQSIQAEQYWKLFFWPLTNFSVMESALKYHHISAGLPPEAEEPASHQWLVENLRSATERIKSCQKDHIPFQVSYLQNLADAIISKLCAILNHMRFVHWKAEQVLPLS